MNYVYEITTPANTPETSKQKTIMELDVGTIVKLEIQFPPGPQGFAHIHINRGLHQVWPHNQGANYRGDDQVIVIPAQYQLFDPPLQFEAFTWNTDDRYEHLIIVRFDVIALVSEELLTLEYLEQTGG